MEFSVKTNAGAGLDGILVAACRRGPVTVAVPLANDPDVIGCIAEAMARGMARFILIGDRGHIETVAARCGVDVSSAEFIQETDEIAACNLAAQLVYEKRARILMKGLVQTSNFSRAFLKKEFALVPEGRLVSHVGLFELPGYHKPLIVTDAALNIAPGMEAKKRIIRNAVEFAVKIGIPAPKVACVAPNEKVNPAIPSTGDAAELTLMSARGEFAPAVVDGPYGLDVAVSKRSAEIKGINTPVAGDADILFMPELNSGNAVYKCFSVFGGGRVAGLIIGAQCPIVLTSRADDEETKLFSLAMAVCSC